MHQARVLRPLDSQNAAHFARGLCMALGIKRNDMSEPDYDAYKTCVDDLNRRQMSNSETYDKSLLTLSSAFLGLSLTFIQQVVPLASAKCLGLLYASWGLFTLSIVLTIASFIYGQSVLAELVDGAKNYFLEGKKEEDARSKVLSGRVAVLNTFNGVVFITAVVSLTVFVGWNVAAR